MSKLSFPLLTISEIQVQLRNVFNLNFLTEDDLTKPRQEALKMIYIRLLMFIYKDLTIDLFHLSEPEKKLKRFPDCHETSTPTIRLFKLLTGLFLKIGCKDDPFKLNDLLKPDYKRTRYYLSALINYLKFISEELTVKMNQNEAYIKNKQKSEELSIIQDQLAKLQLEVSTLNSFLEEKKEEFSIKTQQIEELEKEKKVVLEQKTKIEDSSKLLILENEGLQTNILLLSNSYSEAQSLEKVLRSKIVENGEELFKTLDSKREKLEFMKNCIKKEKDKSNLLNSKIEKIELIRSKVKQIGFVMENSLLEYNKLKELNKNIESLKYEKLVLERKCYEQTSELASLEEKLEKDAKWRETEKSNMESKAGSLKSIIEGKKIEILQVKEEIKKITLENMQKVEVLKDLDRECEEAKNNCEEMVLSLREEIKSVKDFGEQYCSGIMEIMKNSKYSRLFL